MMKPIPSFKYAPPLILLAMGLAVYWPGLSGGFIFDDYPNLVYDPDWKVTSLVWEQWRTAIQQGISSSMGRPLALLSFAANHYFTGLAPFPMKATGLAFHLVNSILVYLLCQQLFAIAPARQVRSRMGGYAALLVALAWLLHPLQVSTVMYVVQRMELGAHTGVLVALLAYLQARLRQQQGKLAWPWFFIVGGATVLGLGFKESALLVPGYLLALEACVLRFRTSVDRPSRVLLGLYAVSTTVALALFALIVLPNYATPEAYSFRDFTVGERLLTQPRVLVTYLGQMLLPLPQHLLFYYDHLAASTGILTPATTMASLVILGALGAMAYIARLGWPLLSLGVCWFFVAHALTSNVAPLELAFEHRNYFALLGVLIGLAQVLASAGQSLSLGARRIVAVLPVLLLALLCSIQSHTWGDPFKLALALGSRNTDSERAALGSGTALLERSRYAPESPLFHLARAEFEHAAARPRSSPIGEQSVIIMLARTRQQVPVALWESVRNKLRLRTAGAQEESALYALLSCRLTNECQVDDQQLFETLATAIDQNPGSPVMHTIYANFAFNVIGDGELAIEVARESSRLAPDDLQYKVNLAKFLLASGNHLAELAAVTREIKSSDTSGYYRRALEVGQSRKSRTSDESVR